MPVYIQLEKGTAHPGTSGRLQSIQARSHVVRQVRMHQNLQLTKTKDPLFKKFILFVLTLFFKDA